jgi:hypothetical protein
LAESSEDDEVDMEEQETAQVTEDKIEDKPGKISVLVLFYFFKDAAHHYTIIQHLGGSFSFKTSIADPGCFIPDPDSNISSRIRTFFHTGSDMKSGMQTLLL